MNGTALISSEGHNYKGEIAKRQWVDAQHLKQGYRLLSESREWQTVYKVTIQAEKLQAYNLTGMKIIHTLLKVLRLIVKVYGCIMIVGMLYQVMRNKLRILMVIRIINLRI